MMNDEAIKRYAFNAPLAGIEAKSLDFLWQKPEKTTKIHRADFYHFIWVESGTLLLNVDFETLSLNAGEAFLISAGQICSFSLDSHPQGYSVLFVPEFLGEAATDISLLRANLLKNEAVPLHGLLIAGLLHQLMSELSSPPDEYQAVITRSCLRILLAEVARRIPHSVTTQNKICQRFINEVEQNFRTLHSVNHYLSLLAIHEKPLAQAVKQATGLSPKAYIDRRRILEAKRMLAYSSLSVKEIGFSLGFDEPTNFNKFFRKHADCSPNEFKVLQSKG